MKLVYVAFALSVSSMAAATPLPMPYDVFAHQNDDDHAGTGNFLHHLVAAETVADHEMHPAHSLAYSSAPGHLQHSSYYSSSDVHPYTGVAAAASHADATTAHTQATQHGNTMVTKEASQVSGNATTHTAAHINHPYGADTHTDATGLPMNSIESHAAVIAHANATTAVAAGMPEETPHNITHGGLLASSVHAPTQNATATAVDHADSKDKDKSDDKKDKVDDKKDNATTPALAEKKPDASEEHKNAANVINGAGVIPLLLTLVATAATAMTLL